MQNIHSKSCTFFIEMLAFYTNLYISAHFKIWRYFEDDNDWLATKHLPDQNPK